MKYQENLEFGWRHSPEPSPPSRNQTLAVAVKKLAKMDIKLFLSCLLSLDFCILFQVFFSGIVVLEDKVRDALHNYNTFLFNNTIFD